MIKIIKIEIKLKIKAINKILIRMIRLRNVLAALVEFEVLVR